MRTLIVSSNFELTKIQKTNLEKGINDKNVIFKYVIDPNTIGIKIFDGEKVYDPSLSKKLEKLHSNIDLFFNEGIIVSEIETILKEKYQEISKNEFISCGRVISSSSGVIHIEGLKNCRYKEIVLIGHKGYALVMNLDKDKVGAILLSGEDTCSYGDLVFPTNKIIEVPVGYGFLGRVVDSLCNPIDGLGSIKSNQRRKIENDAPRIVDRSKVNTPLLTGLLSIDSMIPIGMGQRQLIIGDRQTGKTSIAIDTIINQKGKDVYCIYVAIGQRASSISRLVKKLEDNKALSYTTVVLASASDAPSLQYIAPYTGAALADFFMYEGKNCLIVYDDLSKHAVSYRTISLLLDRPSGREAYPGDIFYIHSKLLERAAKLKQSLGGGSVTAFPIIETQAGDISSYIPTNVISITDGQIYLEKDLFNSGFRPAINVGLSVSRIGGAAQTKLMNKLSTKLRLDIAHYRELAMFSQFGSSLDDSTLEILSNGKKIEDSLCQIDTNPYDYLREIIYLYCITNKLLKDIEDVKKFLDLLYNYVCGVDINLCNDIKNHNQVDFVRLNVIIQEFISYYRGEDE